MMEKIIACVPIWMRLLAECILGVCVALLIRRYVFLLAFVKGRSMQSTLQDGEVVFALRCGKKRKIKRFDVVLCRYPGRKGLFVKRVVALPGEQVAMREDQLYINGEAMREDFLRKKCMRVIQERVVEVDHYFVLGDNRPCSRDSRSVGAIEKKEIIAICKCVVFPFWKIRKI